MPLFIGLILLSGATYKLVKDLHTDTSSSIIYFNVLPTETNAYAHEIDIRLDSSRIVEIDSPLPYTFTCDMSEGVNKGRICMKIFRDEANKDVPLLTAGIEVSEDSSSPLSIISNESYYYPDTSFVNKIRQDVIIYGVNETIASSSKVLGASDNNIYQKPNSQLLIALIAGSTLIVISVVLMIKAKKGKVKELSRSKAGYKKFAGQLFISLFMIITTIIIGQNISEQTQAPTMIDAIGLWKNPVEYFEIYLNYDTSKNLISFDKLLSRGGYIPKQNTIDSELELQLVDKSNNELHRIKVMIPQTLIPPKLEGDDTVDSSLDLNEIKIIAFLPQFIGQSLVNVIYEQKVISTYDVSQYELSESLKSNELRGLAFTIGLEAPNDGFFDIVLIGDNYSLDQMDLFRSNVNEIESTILSINPYLTRSSQIRFQRIENTQDLGCYRYPEVPRCVLCDESLVLNAVNTAGVPYDKIGIIFNDGQYGGCAEFFGNMFRVANGNTIGLIAAHELGHNLGADDEYSYGGDGTLDDPQTCSPSNPNPLWEGTVSSNEYYAQCTYDNYYRSSYDSLMNSFNVEYFNAVSLKRFNTSINELAGPFTTTSPLIDTTILSPSNDDQIDNETFIEASYSDSTYLHRAELWVNDELVLTKYSDFSYFYTFIDNDTPTTLTIKAYDGADMTGTSSTVIINSDITPTPSEPTPTIEPTVEPTDTPFITNTPVITISTSPSITPTISLSPSPTPSNINDPDLYPDLYPSSISRSTSDPMEVYKVKICNGGNNINIIGSMIFEVKNLDNGYNKTYSISVPSSGSCIETEDVQCSDLGIPCNTTLRVQLRVDPFNYITESNETNNVGSYILYADFESEPISITPTILEQNPDLIPHDIHFDSTTSLINASICNTGSNYSGTLQYYLYNLEEDIVENMTKDISLAQSECIYLDNIPCSRLSSECNGDISLEIVLDPENVINENNEVNNRQVLAFIAEEVTIPTASSTPIAEDDITITPTQIPQNTNTVDLPVILLIFGIISTCISLVIITIGYKNEISALFNIKDN